MASYEWMNDYVKEWMHTNSVPSGSWLDQFFLGPCEHTALRLWFDCEIAEPGPWSPTVYVELPLSAPRLM